MISIMHWLQNNIMVVAVDSFLCVSLISYLCYKMIFKNKLKAQQAIVRPQKPVSISSQDIKAIAGDDVIATQLDLARAYIEMGKPKLAEQILNHVIKNGSSSQQQVAERLLVNL